MFKFPRKTAMAVSIAISGVAISMCSSGASQAATVGKATPSGIVEKWVYIETFSGAAPGEEGFLCDQAGQSYVSEGLASQYDCKLSSSGDALYILTLEG